MKAVQTRKLQAYQRILGFLTAYAAALGAVMQLAAVTKLTTIVATLMAGESTQTATTAGRKGLATQAKTIRASLLATMRTIAAIAADAVSEIPQVPEFALPPSNISSGALVGRANGMVEAATAYEQSFIAAGLPTTFLADLTTAASTLSVAITSQGLTKGQRVKATAVVADALTQARAQVKIIDPAVKDALVGDAPTLKEWANVKRITKKGVASASTVTPSPVAPTSGAPAPQSVDHAPAGAPASTPAPTPEVKAA